MHGFKDCIKIAETALLNFYNSLRFIFFNRNTPLEREKYRATARYFSYFHISNSTSDAGFARRGKKKHETCRSENNFFEIVKIDIFKTDCTVKKG